MRARTRPSRTRGRVDGICVVFSGVGYMIMGPGELLELGHEVVRVFPFY